MPEHLRTTAQHGMITEGTSPVPADHLRQYQVFEQLDRIGIIVWGVPTGYEDMKPDRLYSLIGFWLYCTQICE